MKYRRKPIVVDAKQFDPRIKPWPAGVHKISDNRFVFFRGTIQSIYGAGDSSIQIGDWVVTNPDGARHVVSILDFHDLYERLPKARNG